MINQINYYYQKLMEREHLGIKYGLNNPKKILNTLGNPQNSFKTIIISGTNGKGSTGAFLANALQTCNINTGWSTSPHLLSPQERIWINGSYIKQNHLNNILKKIFQIEKKLKLRATYFELILVTTLIAFAENKVDIAILEVGMGGRWDATNISNPILTILTNVAKDHTQYLGYTKKMIILEKLCTARSGCPLIIGPTINQLWIQPLLKCHPIIIPTAKITADTILWDHSIVGQYKIQLAGQHQINNLSIALNALCILIKLGFNLNKQNIWRGIESTTWPGRLWRVPGLNNVFMDGAHNLNGIKALTEHIINTKIKIHIFFSAMSDKDIIGMQTQLNSINPEAITFVIGNNKRYANRNQLTIKYKDGFKIIDIPTAANYLKNNIDCNYLVCGSLYLIGDLLTALNISIT